MTFCFLFIIIAAEHGQMSAAEWPVLLQTRWARTDKGYGPRLKEHEGTRLERGEAHSIPFIREKINDFMNIMRQIIAQITTFRYRQVLFNTNHWLASKYSKDMFQKKERDANLITKNSDHSYLTFNIIQKYSLK
jgi:hypothetical protein